MKLRATSALWALCLAAAVEAAPVTSWIAVNPTTGALSTKPFSAASSDSPVLGNGSEDSAAMVALYADISGSHDGAADVALANGQTVTLSGSATLSGITSAMEQFRWGLFQESTAPFDASGWRGFIASNSAGSGGGALRAKDIESGTFAQTGAAVNLRTAQDGDEFIDETYYFSMSVSRYGSEAVIDASLTSAEDWSQVWSEIHVAAPTSLTFDFNRVGFLAGNGMHANQINFNNIDVTTSVIDAPVLQVVTTGPNAGAVQIRNTRPGDFEIEYYEITSAAGSLNVTGWNSLDDQEGGDPPLAGWDEAAGSGAGLLSEYMLFSTAEVASATSLSLGQAFNAGGAQDLKFFVGLANGMLLRSVVDYVPGGLAGDYNADGVVDAGDYVVWRKNMDTNRLLPNDPVGGTIGSRQFDVWRANFGQTFGSGSVAGANATVPEPTTLVILIVAAVGIRLQRRQIA